MNRSRHRTCNRTAISMVRLLTVGWVLLLCCGCPPAPPSQEEQRRAVTSRWITVECGNPEREAVSCLDEDDLDAISQQVPTISTALAERVRTEMLSRENTDVKIMVSGTGPDYLRFLKEAARVEVQLGRFLESADFGRDERVIVLSDRLADKLFSDADPVGQTVDLDGQMLTIVGVVTDGAPWSKALTRDAYVPLGLFDGRNDSSTPSPCDRLRFRVERLDQVQNTREIIQQIMDQRHPGQSLRIRSFLSEDR